MRLGLRFGFVLVVSVCDSMCFRFVLRFIICILLLFGYYCCVIVWLSDRCIVVVILNVLLWFVCLDMVLRIVCMLWIGMFFLSRFCSIFCSVVSEIVFGMRFLMSDGVFLLVCLMSVCIFWWLSSLVVCWMMRWFRCVVMIVFVLIIV